MNAFLICSVFIPNCELLKHFLPVHFYGFTFFGLFLRDSDSRQAALLILDDEL